MNVMLRDVNNNMIFVGDILENTRNKNTYKVMFSYYTHMDSDTEAYGFWLYGDDLGVHPFPECNQEGQIKLLNLSRNDQQEKR